MRYATLKTLVEQFKAEQGIEGFPVFPGPNDPPMPEPYILLTRYDGAGLSVDDLFDAVGWQVKVVGEQYDYEVAEDLAVRLDNYLRRLHSGRYSGQWVASVARAGGGPSALMVDDADRTHFVCSYFTDTSAA